MLVILLISKTGSQNTNRDVKQKMQKDITFMYTALFVPPVDGKFGI